MNTELEILFTEVSTMAPWLKGNFEAKSKHQKLINFMAANPIICHVKDPGSAIYRCLAGLNTGNKSLQILLEEMKKVFTYNCMREDDPCYFLTDTSQVGLTIPKTITQFYWDKSNPSNILQFQEAISLQTGDLVDFRSFPDYFPVGNFYVKDKVTQFDKGGVILGYRIALWDYVAIEI
ncbi:hypothetical protein [Algoriphagus antarcticus]|uniref:Uncharacterized protein n=1 Tax=Algoriphagus antarcticus TaxID=238540 RepID=A0A3E0E1H7_9BACT|nr:hypothetical protein [Algoriphagus antarcticus]REG92147.1 hypothetical protein C8N25_103226 [Algoriphagus antarcticus]